MMKYNATCGALVVGLALMLAPEAQANRPFFTDDAGVAEQGEMELHLWTELTPRASSDDLLLAPLSNGQISLGIAPAMEISIAAGLGLDAASELTLINPLLEWKGVFFHPEAGRTPGMALAVGVLPPLGFGSEATDGTAFYVNAPFTFVSGDSLAVHVNAGWVMGFDSAGFNSGNLLAGLGVEYAHGGGDVAVIGEVFAGDGADPQAGFGASALAQLGVRWEVSESIILDAGVVGTRDLDWMAQLGMVFLFDLFGTGESEGATLLDR